MIRPQPVRANGWTVWASLAGLLLAAFPISSQAEPNDYARSGPYFSLGLNLGTGNYSWLDRLDEEAGAAALGLLANPSLNATVATGYSATSFLGAGLSLGYRLTHHWSIDFGLDWSRSDLWADVVISTENRRLGTRSKVQGIETGLAMINARFYPLTGRLQPFALAGVGAMMATPVDLAGEKRHVYGFSGQLGAGFDFYVTRRFAVTGTTRYAFATNDTEGSNLFLFNAYLTWRY